MDIEFRNLLEPDAPTVEEEYRRLAASEVPFEASYGRMMLDLLAALHHDIIGPRLTAEKDMFGPGLLFDYSDGHGHRAAIKATVDYKDRSPQVDGIPLLHYRLGCESEDVGSPPEELRTRDVRTACGFILQAIRACRES
jgi:hypothetical protein